MSEKVGPEGYPPKGAKRCQKVPKSAKKCPFLPLFALPPGLSARGAGGQARAPNLGIFGVSMNFSNFI